MVVTPSDEKKFTRKRKADELQQSRKGDSYISLVAVSSSSISLGERQRECDGEQAKRYVIGSFRFKRFHFKLFSFSFVFPLLLSAPLHAHPV